MKLSVWDMDLTVTARPTWTPWLLHWTRAVAPWRAPLWAVPAAAGIGFALRLLDRARLKEIAQAAVMGRAVDPATARAAAEAFAPTVAVRAGALARMAADRAAGFTIVLATASARYYVEALAARWPVDHVIATENVTDAALRHRLAGPNCYGEAKLERVRAWLAGRGADRAACTVRAYSDHISDLPLLAWADAPVAANPSPAMRAEAERRGWEIADWPA